jgi:hypothetical protein
MTSKPSTEQPLLPGGDAASSLQGLLALARTELNATPAAPMRATLLAALPQLPTDACAQAGDLHRMPASAGRVGPPALINLSPRWHRQGLRFGAWLRLGTAGAAAAAVLVLATTTLVLLREVPDARGVAAGGSGDAAPASVTALAMAGSGATHRAAGPTDRSAPDEPGFVPVVAQERWSRLQEEGGAAWVVSAELPAQRLISLGLPFDPARAGDSHRAELLVRASGEVLAVRVLY